MRKTAVKTVGIIMILCLVLWYANHVLSIKDDDGVYSMKKFYELDKNTVDVLVVGSSHAYSSFNTGVLWREQGISSYVLSGSAQPLWNSYYCLREALKTQTPKLIVLEGYRVVEEEEFVDIGYAIKNTYGMKWSRNRLDAVWAGVPQEERLGFLLGYTQYHDRYKELSEEDFTFRKKAEKYRDWRGFEPGMITESVEEPDIGASTECEELTEKSEKYYRAILALAKERNIPIMVVVAPFASMTEEDLMRFNTAQKIAQEYETPFLNYNVMREEMPINYATDMLDESHLNIRGSCKFTSGWGEYIAGRYHIPDHRGDLAYEGWERNAAYLDALLKDMELRETEDTGLIQEAILQNHYDVFVSVDGYCQTQEAAVSSILAALGISDAQGGGLWHFAGGDGIVWSSGNGEDSRYFETDRHDFGLKRVQMPDGGYDNEIVIDNQRYQTVENGINVVVFDRITGIVADSFGIDGDDGYQLCR